jgi:very-short-patch-repair endonuclease
MERIPVAPDIAKQLMGIAREFRGTPTSSEARLWEALRNRQLDGAKFRRQQQIGPFIVDFFCPAQCLIVEVDGSVHDMQREHDVERQRLLEACGYRVVRVSAEAVTRDMPGVLSNIAANLSGIAPPLHCDGEGVGG